MCIERVIVCVCLCARVLCEEGESVGSEVYTHRSLDFSSQLLLTQWGVSIV